MMHHIMDNIRDIVDLKAVTLIGWVSSVLAVQMNLMHINNVLTGANVYEGCD